jgi:hypothetical protein
MFTIIGTFTRPDQMMAQDERAPQLPSPSWARLARFLTQVFSGDTKRSQNRGIAYDHPLHEQPPKAVTTGDEKCTFYSRKIYVRSLFEMKTRALN